MISKVEQFLAKHQIPKSDKILLGLSGGIDSMCLLKIFQSLKLDVVACHMNFGLRDNAVKDEGFVRAYCTAHSIPLKVKSVNTEAFAKQEGISIQMAARELRYNWFHQLLNSEGINWLALAHHADDQLETVLINLAKGYSPRMLAGFKAFNPPVIRPLIEASKEQLVAFSKNERVPFREDKSNADTKYLRNQMRHEIVPKLKEIESGILGKVNEQVGYLQDMIAVFDEQVNQVEHRFVTQHAELKKLDVEALRKEVGADALLFEYLRTIGLEPKQLKGLKEWEEGIWPANGRKLQTKTHHIYFYEPYLWIAPILKPKKPVKLKPGKAIDWFGLTITIGEKPKKKTANGLYISEEQMAEGVFLRSPEPGDTLKLSGMRGKKNLADFLSEQKLTVPQKERVALLCTKDEILSVLGHRDCKVLQIVEEGQKGYLAALEFKTLKTNK